MKSVISMLAAASVAVAALAAPAIAADKGYVGIAMPTKGLDRWNKDGASMVQQFQEAGYKTDLQYAENEIPAQLSQVENMITKGVDVLVIAAIDGGSLTAPLANAAAAGIPVIAYDRLILNTPNVDYYATFDNFKVGVIQGNSLVEGLKSRFPDTKPWNVELFGGSPDDNNAYFFYNGAMSVIQPLIDSGDIVRDHTEASRISQAVSGRKVTRQTMNILPRIREVDELLQSRPALRDRIFEVHPELSFRALQGSTVVDGKRTPAGRRCRRDLLADVFGSEALAGVEEQIRGTPARTEDLLDALACLWSADRIARGVHGTVPEPPEHDAEGQVRQHRAVRREAGALRAHAARAHRDLRKRGRQDRRAKICDPESAWIHKHRFEARE